MWYAVESASVRSTGRLSFSAPHASTSRLNGDQMLAVLLERQPHRPSNGGVETRLIPYARRVHTGMKDMDVAKLASMPCFRLRMHLFLVPGIVRW
jgi:hypothetical protein